MSRWTEAALAPAYRRSRSGDRTPRAAGTLWLVRGVAAVAAGLSLLSDAAPTGTPAVDAIWRAVGVAALALTASRATRGPWLWLTAVAAVAAVPGPGLFFAGPALVLVVAVTRVEERSRLVGAVAGGLAGVALLMIPSWGPHGTASLVVAVAVVPLLPPAYERSTKRMRRNLRRGAVAASVAVVVVAGAAGLALALASGSLLDGVDRAEGGLAAVADADGDAAADDLRRAGDDLERAEGLLTGPWMIPARGLPVVAQHVEAVAEASTAAADVVRKGERVATSAPYQDLRSEDGQVDLRLLAGMRGPVDDAVASLRSAERTIAEVRSPWLVAPLADALGRFSDEVADARPDAELAADGLRVAPGLLGADGERRYLVLLTTPAETRNLGGFTGAYAVLEADLGQIDLARSGEIAELSEDPAGADRTIEGHDEFLTRYGRYRPARLLQNLTVSPDMETTAEVAGSLYEQTTGEPVDGVVVADPFALAAFLELTGPVQVPSIEDRVSADNAAELLLRDQYVLFQEEAERKDRLQDVGEATFDALTSRSLPGPGMLGDVLGPVVREKRLMFFPMAEDEQAFIDEIGALGRFERPEGSDLISVRTANLRANKIDTFVHRTTTYDATYDPTTGRVDATVTLVVRNEAPESGLPDYILGPEGDGLPSGTASLRASVFSPLELSRATLDGEGTGVEPQRELGLNVFSVPITVAAGEEATVTIRLSGTIEGMGSTYRLLASSQPLANPDRLSVRVRPAERGSVLSGARGFDVDDGEATAAVPWSTDRRLAVTVDD